MPTDARVYIVVLRQPTPEIGIPDRLLTMESFTGRQFTLPTWHASEVALSVGSIPRIESAQHFRLLR